MPVRACFARHIQPRTPGRTTRHERFAHCGTSARPRRFAHVKFRKGLRCRCCERLAVPANRGRSGNRVRSPPAALAPQAARYRVGVPPSSLSRSAGQPSSARDGTRLQGVPHARTILLAVAQTIARAGLRSGAMLTSWCVERTHVRTSNQPSREDHQYRDPRRLRPGRVERGVRLDPRHVPENAPRQPLHLIHECTRTGRRPPRDELPSSAGQHAGCEHRHAAAADGPGIVDFMSRSASRTSRISNG